MCVCVYVCVYIYISYYLFAAVFTYFLLLFYLVLNVLTEQYFYRTGHKLFMFALICQAHHKTLLGLTVCHMKPKCVRYSSTEIKIKIQQYY